MVSLCKIFDCHKFPKEHAALSELNGAFDLVVSAYDGMAGLGDNVPARAKREWELFRSELHKRRGETVTREVDVHDPESGEPMDADTIPVEDDIHVRGDDTADRPPNATGGRK